MATKTTYSFDLDAFTAWTHENEFTLRITNQGVFFTAILSCGCGGQGASVASAIADLADKMGGKPLEIEGGETLMVPSFTKIVKEG